MRAREGIREDAGREACIFVQAMDSARVLADKGVKINRNSFIWLKIEILY